MESSAAVREALLAFYDAFNTGDADTFGGRIADSDGVSVIGSAPGEGHDGRSDWLRAYETGIGEAGLRLERGGEIVAYEGGQTGFAVDTPSFQLSNGARLPTRLTAVLTREGDDWKMVHAHFSVGVPDEQAFEMPGGAS